METTKLESSWTLEHNLKNIECSKELKKEIIDYIEKQTPPKGYRFSNVIYRSNLHYIIDNIKKPSLLIELKKINER
jgi:hypothetical protein